ncbi:ATP-binding protein, partial [Pseudobacillus badius]
SFRGYRGMNPELFDFEHPLVLYVKYGTWANEIRQMYQVNDEDYNLKTLRLMQRMKNVPLLILDDIGSGRITPIIKDLTYDIIDHRKENRKSTLYTTNISIPALESEQYLGELITSRMLFKTAVYQLGGRNRRKEQTYYL